MLVNSYVAARLAACQEGLNWFIIFLTQGIPSTPTAILNVVYGKYPTMDSHHGSVGYLAWVTELKCFLILCLEDSKPSVYWESFPLVGSIRWIQCMTFVQLHSAWTSRNWSQLVRVTPRCKIDIRCKIIPVGKSVTCCAEFRIDGLGNKESERKKYPLRLRPIARLSVAERFNLRSSDLEMIAVLSVAISWERFSTKIYFYSMSSLV
jgi:hypothetical protein